MKIINPKKNIENEYGRYEYKIGDLFEMESKKFTVIKHSGCLKCCFMGTSYCRKMSCVGWLRKDRNNVMFIEI